MALAIFDLDNTLIAGDSDYLWGKFMCEQKLVDVETFRRGNDHFYEQYEQGTMNIHEYLGFALEPLTRYSMEELKHYHDLFMTEQIRPIMLEKARTLLQKHRDQGDHLMIITATSRFVTEPIAREFGVDTLLAIEAEIKDNRYTGNVVGTPTFQGGKVIRLQEWLTDNPGFSLEGSYFYSDSKNDLPLLQTVDYPFAVNPDPELERVARKKNWTVLNLR
ncbi:phosphoserine phosphatase [Endozoicomonas montiporae]|uniref:Histidinol-phosphatase n=2 Tax=Endozoicomonas montiporae TaxID=1027273 RepID=A0A081N1T0_9GAMM|nr:HAD family hydrolase [Endozoicomonas montiporae]AMO58655.1 HAD family hydrolase [Endozoicomonas montiporae CL-33]KEQ12403.1 phosphoserine phosphatase [Endozoicomonas montiporae]